MAMPFKTIGLFGTHHNPLVHETVVQVYKFLQSLGISSLVESSTAQTVQGKIADSGMSLAALASEVDCCIAVGGDGNLLSVARAMAPYDVPVVGINRGRLGFLADLSSDDFKETLSDILNGQYYEESRSLLSARVMRNDQMIVESTALNDVVISSREAARVLSFEVFVGDEFVSSYISDGMIIATPTGSTAYSLSAGGPIVQPHLNVMILNPLNPHTLTSRPLIIDANATVRLVIVPQETQEAHVSFDGQGNQSLLIGDTVMVESYAKPLRLIHPKNYDYYGVLRNKLHWADHLIKPRRA